MGFNTTVFILNDQFDAIQRNPKRFVDDIAEGMVDGDNHMIGQSAVMKTQHADVFRLYGTHQNSIIDLNPWSKDTAHRYRTNKYFRPVARQFIKMARTLLNELELAFDEMDKENWDD